MLALPLVLLLVRAGAADAVDAGIAATTSPMWPPPLRFLRHPADALVPLPLMLWRAASSVIGGAPSAAARPRHLRDLPDEDIHVLNEIGVNLADVDAALSQPDQQQQQSTIVIQQQQPQGGWPTNILANGLAQRMAMAPEAFMTTPELIKMAGYPVEIHKVVTEDGYVLEVHRLPLRGSKKPPVYLQHGILCSSSDWVIAGPEKGLAYLLHHLGYDVWMGNFRGNRYSRSHAAMDPDKHVKAFWDFSFHESGVFDVPAIIDHVLEQTGKADLLYVGHSMGTTAFFVMLSEKPAYNAKVRAMSAMAPVAHMNQVRSPVLWLAAQLHTPLAAAANLVGIREFLPNNLLFTLVGQIFCREQAITQAICYNIMFSLTGFDSSQLNTTLLPVLLAHMPAGTSVKTLTHYGQVIRNKSFRMYDLGMFNNLRKYGSIRPPEYNLNNIQVPVSLHYSENDWVSGPNDVTILYSQLSNRVGHFRVRSPTFNHVDFLWGKDVKTLVYDTLIEILESQSAR